MTVQSKGNLDKQALAKLFTKEYDMSNHDHDFVMDGQIVGSDDDYRRTIFHQITDLDAANEAANSAAAWGFDYQIWFEHQRWPIAGAAFLVALNDPLRGDIRDRREYLNRLLTLKLPMPLVVISRDFLLDVPIVVHPGVLLAPRLDDNIFRAIRSGHLSSTEEGAKRKAA